MSNAILVKPIPTATVQKLPVGRVKPDSRLIAAWNTPLIAAHTSIGMRPSSQLHSLDVPRGWQLVERLVDPDALLLTRPLTPSQVGMIQCKASMCKARATMRYGIFRRVNGRDVLRSSGMFACTVEHTMPHTTYRQDKPDASLYPLEAFRRVKGSSIGRSHEGGAMPGRHAGGKSARKSRVVASMIDDGWD